MEPLPRSDRTRNAGSGVAPPNASPRRAAAGIDGADRLDLPEEVFLLALRDDGRIGVEHLPYAVGGAILAELEQRGLVAVEGSGRKQRVRPLDAELTGVETYDECLERIRGSRRPRAPTAWVQRFGDGRTWRRVGDGLCQRGVLRQERRRVLWVFPSTRHLQVDEAWRRDILLRLAAVVLEGRPAADRRTLALLALANGIGLLRFAFGRKAMRPHRAQVKQLVEDDPFGRAVRKAVEAAQAAAAAATTTTTYTTSSS